MAGVPPEQLCSCICKYLPDAEFIHTGRATVNESDLELSDGRRLHVYDTRAGGDDTRLTVFWQHGTANLGEPPEPLLPSAAQRGIRWVSHDRPGYGGSTPHPGRDVASAAADAATIADALGIGQFAVMGHSGGGPYALAFAALLPERVLGVACISGLAPFGAEGLDWFAGMASAGAAARPGLSLQPGLLSSSPSHRCRRFWSRRALAGDPQWNGGKRGE